MTRPTLVPKVILLAAIQLGAAVQADPDSKPQPLAFVNVNVVPMDSEHIIVDQTVLIQGGRIHAIDPSATASIPDGTIRIDGTGKYLMPGLADMHVHLWDEGELLLFVANGVTTIRNLFGDPKDLQRRAEVEQAKRLGPTIYTSGPIIDGDPPSFPGSDVVTTPVRAREVVASQAAAGYDFIKVLNGVPKDAYDALIETAKRHGMKVVGHVPTAVGLHHVLESRQYSIEHFDGFGIALAGTDQGLDGIRARYSGYFGGWGDYDESKVPAVAAKVREAGTWICPTLVVLREAPNLPQEVERKFDASELRYMAPQVLEFWRKRTTEPETVEIARRTERSRKRGLVALYREGARLILGTDCINPFVLPGFSAHQELHHLVDAGLTPYEAIKTGTYDAAEFLGALDNFGTVTVGRRADLVLVSSNPLEDVSNVAKRVGVMVRGRWLPKAELQAKLDALAQQYAKLTAEGEATVAIENVNVVPMDRETVLPDQTVMVRDGRIVSIGPASEADVPAFATRIDGSGKFLMPGLADMHVHTWGDTDMPLFLANGVTSIRNMWGAPIHLAWQKQIEAGEFLAPTIYTTSALIDGDPPIWEGSEVAATPEDARKIVAEQKAAGYSDLKIYSLLKSDVFAAIAEEAKANGMRFVGHVPDDVGLAGTLDAGMASIEHLTGYITALQADDAPPIKKSRYSFGVASRHVDDTKIPKVAEATREAGTWNCVTLVVMDKLVMPIEERKKLLQSPEVRYLSPATLGMWDPSKSKRLAKLTDEDFAALRDGTSMLRKITRALHEGGARILLGTDCPNPLVVPGFAIHEELRNLVGAGLSPYEAIRAGTANAAEFLKETGEFGIVRTGARADLILLEASPLDDVANVQKRVGVMVRGKWLPEKELHRMLEETAASFAPKKNPFEGLADLPKEGTRLMKGRYEMLVGDAAFGYERIAVSHLESGESVIHAQMILTAWSRAETRTRLASGKSELGESLRIEYEAATGKTTLECLRQKGMLVLRGTVMGTAIDRSEPIETEQLLGTSSMAATYLLARRLRSLEIGDEIELSDKAVDLSPNLNFEKRTRKLKREPDRPDGRRVYSIEGKGKSVKGEFRGSLVVDPSGLPVEYRIEQAMGTFVFRLIGE